jgi:ketosteroid isomerase-like protein
MTAADNKALITRVFAELVSGNREPFVEVLHEDVQWTISGTTTWSGTFSGKQAVLNDLLGVLRAKLVDRIQLAVDHVLADEDRVVVQARGRATTTTGQPYNNSYCLVYRMADGTVREITEYLDTALVASALGDRV